MLPVLLFIVNKRLVKLPPGGSALPDFFAVNILALRKAGIRGFGRAGYWDRVKPSVMGAEGDNRIVRCKLIESTLVFKLQSLTRRLYRERSIR
jgi:hypothetical protein